MNVMENLETIKLLRNWACHNRLVTAMIGLGICIGLSIMFGTATAAVKAPTVPTVETPGATVLCVNVVVGSDAVPWVIFQRAGATLEDAMREGGQAALVERGYRLEKQNCFESWQAAANFLTDNQVMLPDGATEADFVRAMMKWQKNRPSQ